MAHDRGAGGDRHWRTIEALAATGNVEVIINLPLGMASKRLIERSGDISESWRRSLDACFGSHAWYGLSYREQGYFFRKTSIAKVDDAGARLLQYYAGRRKDLFGPVATPSVVRNTRGMPIYYILWAGPKPLGLKTAEHVLRRGERIRRPSPAG